MVNPNILRALRHLFLSGTTISPINNSISLHKSTKKAWQYTIYLYTISQYKMTSILINIQYFNDFVIHPPKLTYPGCTKPFKFHIKFFCYFSTYLPQAESCKNNRELRFLFLEHFLSRNVSKTCHLIFIQIIIYKFNEILIILLIFIFLSMDESK